MFVLARLRPAWGDQGAGTAWLSLGIGITFVLGLALQLLGLRTLDDGDYATFVFGLGIGNVASAIAAAIQPTVAVRVGSDRPAFLPAPLTLLALGAGLAGAVAALLLAPKVGTLIALLALLQVPIHAVVGVGFGRLQGMRRFVEIAVALVLLFVVRIAAVLPALILDRASATPFVLGLPVALIAALAVLLLVGAYRGTDWRVATDGRQLLASYALWALFAWLLNADAIFARLRLSAPDADAYALAFTLGRQPIYAVAPLAMVLLPVTLLDHPRLQRARLRAILAISALLLVGTLLTLGIWTRPLVRLLTGESGSGDVGLIRGYAVVGSLAAAATLLLTFTFALGSAPRLRSFGLLTLASGLAALTWVTNPDRLLALQGAVVAVLVIVMVYLGVRATAVGPPDPPILGGERRPSRVFPPGLGG